VQAEHLEFASTAHPREASGVTDLKYAQLERERRWLLVAVPDLPDDARRLEITDRYVRRTRLRLREVTEADGTVVRKLGHKVRVSGGPAEVAHTSVYLDEGEWEVLAQLPADVLTKTRTQVEHDGMTVNVDVFSGHLAGLVLAEIDSGRDPEVELPATYGSLGEVSDEEAFTGAELAREALRRG
jgi:CYTH domain-containing protein